MLNKNVSKLLNEQINKEMFSAYLYLDMAHYYINKGLEGFANWFKVQAKEEMDHATLFIEYLQNNGVEVELDAIAKPTMLYKDDRVLLVEALKHEEFVTASINTIYEEALKAHEFKTQEFLHWFIKEQVEEEKNATDLISAFDLHYPHGVFALDGKLQARVYQAPSLKLN
ncbi:MAG: ferritin [Bacilli bacterium]